MTILKNSNLRKNFLIIKMSQIEKSIYEESSESETDSLLTDSLSSQSTDSDYIPSQTPESEDYTSYESSEPLTPTESDYSTDNGTLE